MANDTIKPADDADAPMPETQNPDPTQETPSDDVTDPQPENIEPPSEPRDADNPSTTAQAEDAEARADIEPAPPPPAATPPATKASIMPMVLSGALCAAFGFGAAVLTQQNSPLWPDDPDRITFETQTRSTIESLSAQIAALDARPIADVSATDLDPIRTDVAKVGELDARLSALDTEFKALVDRVSALEKSTIEAAVPDELIAKYRAEIEEINAFLDSQRTEIQGFMENAKSTAEAAETMARTATIRGALDKISVAMDSGLAFDDVIADLDRALDGATPQALKDTATDGVATVQALTGAFAQSARKALATARGELDQGTGIAKFGNFLKSQFNARSVTPQDGDDPDAILSRAEAAIRDGRVEEALSEIDALSADAKAQMSDWIAAATARLQATQAIDSLKNDLPQ